LSSDVPSGVSELHRWARHMDWRFNTIWFDQLPQDEVLRLDLRKERIRPTTGRRYVILRGYRQKNGLLDAFPESPDTEYLEVLFSNFMSFAGIGRLPQLRRLEVHHCYKLSGDNGLSEVRHSLRHLHINQSKKFLFGEDLRSLRNIEVLCLNRCGEIEDLSFLECFPRLVDFRFVDTNIRSGDLVPLLKHPSLRSVGFMGCSHYNLSVEDVENHFSKGSIESGREYVSRGQWKTFRYLSEEEWQKTKAAQPGATDNPDDAQ